MENKIKIGIVIPTRGDRPQLLENCLKQISLQTVQPDVIELVDDQPLSLNKDITYRYRIGVERILKKDVDVIFFWEDDDWYSINYIETMLSLWDQSGRPNIFGFNQTTYYHIKLAKFVHLKHHGRSSMFNTMVTAEVMKDFKWNEDNDPWTDIHLWKSIEGVSLNTDLKICIGMKHGIGLSGGVGHNDGWMNSKTTDTNRNYLKAHLDYRSLQFYLGVK